MFDYLRSQTNWTTMCTVFKSTVLDRVNYQYKIIKKVMF